MDVTIFEQATPSVYDPTKAYLYMVNGRGQTWTQRFPQVQDLLIERGSAVAGGMGNLCIVPADPKEPIPERKAITQGMDSEKVVNKESYWIPRHTMTELLEEVIQKQNERNSGECGTIDLRLGMRFVSMDTVDGGNMLKVTVQNTKDPENRFEETAIAPFVVGADGAKSQVRECLADDVTKPLKVNWLHNKPKKFRVKKWTSPASDLRMKVLQFPPGFKIPNADGTYLQTQSETVYAIRSVNKGPRNYVSLGLLPMKDPHGIRPTNVITRPNHDVWKLKSGDEIREWFVAAFPRLDLDEMIDNDEWDRFARAQGTSFPKCQYCPGLEVSSPDGSAGVALVGDACHAFPPDIGQGINMGLQDVEALDRALVGRDLITNEQSETPATLGAALKTYEKVHAPEVASVIRLSRFGSPYQYRQPLYKDRIGRFLWTMNVAFRLLLNKLSFGIIPPAAIMMAQNNKLTFRQVMRRADLETAGLTACFLAIAWKIFDRFFFKKPA
jgi:2-polyprenyl-6-methoxyphenol hydroxylase-like FAD-dependent oxidoreductase